MCCCWAQRLLLMLMQGTAVVVSCWARGREADNTARRWHVWQLNNSARLRGCCCAR